ncbi:Pimeloyl-ACP methyl ester carboxylesterase [Streptoalloteichus tenebrarius]|uniref:Pimeloyl-ACP methyl ester carboxylesterase n=1 Tax=Streptoalloteichus tenebrarius (strain ATCC 17920 / DSM 40477 / JCM 4838 / CBS 697.72 / NBRC 16177 / NCIMB 11028 / NRRL B-12390 / A12253. 1 / ISP 5477) TaxID=1933 RepID=A0ABT1HYQ6_STRSD|nr:alpha/beta hydrolase [Streptoalloteichus tenebrarius]MCP2260661.1 Pimeloyl-ACP methyl ester carboxylesterase [Streptoalloteichus tenebrarius]BFF03809.1 alpha/beta hydrolase [Streptoalloteichus tenebrarius]
MELTSRWTAAAGTLVHSRAGGDAGPPLVLVHGLGVASPYWERTAAALAPWFRVHAPDLPGFGHTIGPREALDVHQLAEALADWMRTADAWPAVVVGNSMGCQITVDLAVCHPELVRRAVLVGPTIDRTAPGALSQVFRLVRNGFREPPRQFWIVARDYARAGLGRVLRTFLAAMAEPTESWYPRVSAPTLVVRGERDALVTAEWAARVTNALPHGGLVTLRGAAHTANQAAPEALARVVRVFAEEQSAEPAGGTP